MPTSELPPERLRAHFAKEQLNCDTSETLKPARRILGQDRALEALQFGLEMKGKGFNVYAAGLPGTGKNTAVRRFVRSTAQTRPAPPDWCYVANFRHPYEPRALRLPPGRARGFHRDMKALVEEARRTIPAALQRQDLLSRRDLLMRKADDERSKILEGFSRKAASLGFAVQVSNAGITLIPSREGKPLTDPEIQTLPASRRRELTKNQAALATRLDRAAKQLADLGVRTQQEIRILRDGAVRSAIQRLVSALARRYPDVPGVVRYLRDLGVDLMENADLFAGAESEEPEAGGGPGPRDDRTLRFRRYEVNVMVDHTDRKGAPVIAEANPTYNNLFGRIENEARFGTLVTDFTLIKGGALHKANGGFLILRVDDLAKDEASYAGLKRALQSGTIAIEETGERLGMTSTKSLTPEAIPLNVKVVLIGDPSTYETLYEEDPDFGRLFKVKADFDDVIPRTPKNVALYGRFIHSLVKAEGLHHLDAAAIAKVVEHGSRLAEDQTKLSTRFSDLADLVREADFYAAHDGAKRVTAMHIAKALDEKVHRSNLFDEKLKEMIARGVLLIDTAGAKVGQVNGLTVMNVGDLEFGQPSRVTASVGLGREGIIDIEREAKLGGQIHTKGVLILSGYLTETYARDKPLSLACRLVLEQSYGGVEGDSASSTELYAILSALADLPIKQTFAVTGSVNQKGEVQAIGGVNEKIEGFFEVCKAKGLKGDEGVLIPESNTQHLMLREDVVDAVRQGRFHIYAVKTISEGIEILTGVQAGVRGENGRFETGCVNDRVDRRLMEMAHAIARFAGPPAGDSGPRRPHE
jgi:lon-related putative ATP-dependent protease